MTAQIHVRDASINGPDVRWAFRDSQPSWSTGSSSAKLDPFPGYPHDRAVVDAAVALVQERWAPSWDVHLFVADREELGRSNGFSQAHSIDYDREKGDFTRNEGLIFLSGKRVPPHPAVTRYLVAHEYGHNVEWMLEVGRGDRLHTEKLIREYAQMRGLDGTHRGDGGRWHDAPSEVFACDFRIVVCGVEPEFWPHPGVPRPEVVPAVAQWWADAAGGGS